MVQAPAWAFHSPMAGDLSAGPLLMLGGGTGLVETREVRLGPEVFPNWKSSRDGIASSATEDPSAKGWASKSVAPAAGINRGGSTLGLNSRSPEIGQDSLTRGPGVGVEGGRNLSRVEGVRISLGWWTPVGSLCVRSPWLSEIGGY